MKKYLTLLTIIVILITSVLFLNSEIIAVKDNSSPSSIINDTDLEDSLIINELKMESDEPQSSDDIDYESKKTGKIIQDDTFVNTIIDYDKIKTKVNVDEIDKLKSKNKQWHVSRYKIKKNDNLWKIAKKFGINHKYILNLNEIKNPNMLRPGKYINIPNKNGMLYSIKKNDTLGKISKKYKISLKKIFENNKVNPKKLRVGSKLFLADVIHRRNKKISKKSRRKKNRIAGIKFIWPLRGRITSGFGMRRNPFNRRSKRQFHCGIDISANLGTPVRASAGGRVFFTGWKRGYGKVVMIRHKNGYISVYAHNNRNLVKKNQIVKRGKVIAYSGKTGAVTGAHLHFEIRKYVTPLNPLRLLRRGI